MKINSMDHSLAAMRPVHAGEAAASKADEVEKAPPEQAGLHAQGAAAHGGLHLSQRVEEVERIGTIAREEPGFRPDVVEQAKADLAAGTLRADPNELASLIARDLF